MSLLLLFVLFCNDRLFKELDRCDTEEAPEEDEDNDECVEREGVETLRGAEDEEDEEEEAVGTGLV